MPGAGPEALLAIEAQTLLDAAASQHPVDMDRLRMFARACLELSETGRLALAVLDGGHASRRALELAAHVRTAIERSDDHAKAHAIRETGA